MDEDTWLERFGLRPSAEHLSAVRDMLSAHAELERRSQGMGDTVLMKLCCIQLFNAGEPADALLIWAAKEASFDSHCSIDVQLMCGQGLAETKAYLASEGSADADEALAYLLECEEARDFEEFSVKDYSAWWDSYYGVG